MDGGLLSLKWNNHRSTFIHVLSTVRLKESYCDVTLACDGKFYPVHKLVLSTCSEYFEQMFERTACKHPIIVLKDIGKEDLEALLNYMYLGEVNVLQNNLSGLIKAAEGLRIKGLAVPDEAPTDDGNQDAKRPGNWTPDTSDAKRRRGDDQAGMRTNADKAERSPGYRDAYRPVPRSREPSRGSVASPAPSPVTPTQDGHHATAATTLHDTGQDLTHELTPAVALHTASNDTTNSSSESLGQVEQELKLDQTLVKEEPQDNYSDTEETKDPLQTNSDQTIHFPGLVDGGGGGGGGFNQTIRPPANQPHPQQQQQQQQQQPPPPQTIEDLVALPGASGLQVKGLWDGDRGLLGLPYEGYNTTTTTNTTSQPRSSQMVTIPLPRRSSISISSSSRTTTTTTTTTPRNNRRQQQQQPQQQPQQPQPRKPQRPKTSRSRAQARTTKQQQQHQQQQPSQTATTSTSTATATIKLGHICPFCANTAFSNAYKLKRHMLIHTGERPHSCPHCAYRARHKSHMKSHIWRKHKKLL